MSLNIALQNALSGLQANESAIQIIANNVTNANTEGYTRKTAAPLSRVLNGEGRGVNVSDISRQVDERLLTDLRRNLSILGNSRARDSYYQRILDQFGTLSDDRALGSTIAGFSTALQNLAATPESSAHRNNVVATAVTLAKQINDLSGQIQILRQDADKEIAAKLTVINGELQKIADLNRKIESGQSLGEATEELQDVRDQAINALSEMVDIRYYRRTSGEIVVTLPDGRVLADRKANVLSHAAAGGMSPDISYPANGITGILVNGTDITATINTGELKGLIDARDAILPNLQAEIDYLAQRLRDEVNTLHNAGTSYPAPNRLTGTRSFVNPATATITTSADVRIAVVDGTGKFVAYTDLAAGTYTVQQIDTLIDTNLAGFAAASSASGGPLSISANAPGNGIAIVDLGTQTVTHTDGLTSFSGFSNYFGLNDFFVTPGRVQGDSTTGLGRLMSVRSDVAANPGFLARGRLTADTAPPPAAGDQAIAVGDGTTAQALADKFLEELSFAAAGDLSLTSTTLGGYASEILSFNAVSASSAEKDVTFRETLAQELTYRNQSVSGVNIDEELRNLVLYENAYAATARIVQVVDTLFDTLIQMVR